MTDMYEAGELLTQVQRILDKAGDRTIVQTPDGRDPVYWPYTIYGRSGMMKLDDIKPETSDNLPPITKSSSSQDQSAQTSP